MTARKLNISGESCKIVKGREEREGLVQERQREL